MCEFVQGDQSGVKRGVSLDWCWFVWEGFLGGWGGVGDRGQVMDSWRSVGG